MMARSETDKGKLVKFLKAQRVLLETILEQITEEAMLIPGVEGDYSVKDIIAHIAVWDRRGTHWIESAARGETPAMPVPGKTWADLDELNAQTYLEFRDRSLADVMEEFEDSYPPLLGAAQHFPEGEIARPITFFNGTSHETMPAGRLIAWRYRHYRSHGFRIRAWANDDH